MAASGCICTFVSFLLRTCSQSIALGGHGTGPVVARKAPRAAQEPAEAGLTCLLLLLSQITSWDSRAIISRSSISLNTTLSPDPCFFPRSQQEAHWARTAVLTLSVSFLLDSLWGSLCILSAQGEEVLLSELLFCARK